MNRADRKRQAKEDEQRLVRGIDTESRDAEPTAAMARQMYALLERAKRDHNIDPPVKYLHDKVDATLQGMKDIPVACAKGCSHCCHAWVSATALEVLFVAKLIRREAKSAAVENVRAAHFATKDFDFSERSRHPHPCPLLVADLCSIYPSRPDACRFAVSMDAARCLRVLRNLSGEGIPTPGRHLRARGIYEMAMAIALRHAGFPYHHYEFNAALTRALEREDAERAWLAGEDIFAGVRRDPHDAFASNTTLLMYRRAFGEPATRFA
jgi:hypothetical protein